MSLNRYIRVAVLVILGLWVEDGLGQEWNWASRVDLSVVRDNNVFESLSDHSADYAGRILVEFSSTGRPLKDMMLSIHYTGGLEAYWWHTIENRMVNDATTVCEIPLNKRFSIGANFHGRSKTFFHAQRGYRFFQGSPFIRWTSSFGLTGTIFYSQTSLDYAEGSQFDYQYRNGGILLEFAFWPGVQWDLQLTLGALHYDRSAFDYEEMTFQTYQWFEKGIQQKDHLKEVSTTLEVYKWALIRIGFSYQKNTSNSYGYSYRCPKIKILAAKSFPWGLTLSLYWTLLLKQYTDSLQPILQLRPDTENEENSFILADLSKDLRNNLSLRFRLGRYKNESPFRDLYYEKNIISVGITQRF